jgi:hypothetical protein
MSGINILRRLLMKEAVKKSGQTSGIMSIGDSVRKLADKRLQSYLLSAQKQGVDLDKLGEQEIRYMLEMNKPKAPRVISQSDPEFQGITEALFGKRGKVIEGKFGKPFAEEVKKFKGPVKEKQDMGDFGKINVEVDYSASLDKPEFFGANAKNMFGETAATGSEFIKKQKERILNTINRKNKEMVPTTHSNYKLLKKSLQDQEDALEAIKITEDLGGNENMFDFLRTKNISDYKSKPLKRSDYVKTDDPDIEDFAGGGVAGMLGERPGFRFGGGYQGSNARTGKGGATKGGKSKSSSQGPAGGASAGGNYGGNRNPSQTYGGTIFSGGGGGGNQNTGGGGPPSTNTGGGGGGTTPTPTTTEPSFRERTRQKQILNYLKSLEEEELASGFGRGKILGGIFKPKLGPKQLGIEYFKDNPFGDSLKLNLDTEYKDLLKGKVEPKLKLEGNKGNLKYGFDIDTDKNINFGIRMPFGKQPPGRKVAPSRFAPDISRFNFEDLTGIKSQLPANMQMAKTYSTKDIENLLGIKDQATAEQFVEDPFTSSPRFITREKRTEPRTQAEAMDLFRENLIREETDYPGKTFDQQRSGALEYGIRPTDRSLIPSDFLDKPGEAATQMPFSTIAEEIEEKYPMAEGGIARQNFAMGRRAFLKMLAGTGAGIAGLKTGIMGLGGKKVATEVAKDVATTSGGTPPPYFFNLVKKIKNLGDDATSKFANQPREKVTKYKDYELTEDLTTGEQTIQKFKLGDDGPQYYDETLAEETYMNYKPGKSQVDETTGGKVADEYIEDTSYLRTSGPQKGEIVDTVDGVGDDVVQEGTMFEDDITDFATKKVRTKKAGGGVAYMLGQ